MHAHLGPNQKKIRHPRRNWEPFERYVVRSSLANVSGKSRYALHCEFMSEDHTGAIIQNL